MKTIKKILFPLFSLFLMYRTIDLLRLLILSQPKNFDLLDDTVYSLLLALFITGIFAFPGFEFATNKLLPESYYRLKNSTRLKYFHRLLGVKYFNIFLMIYWGRKKNRKKYFDGTRKGLTNFMYQSKQSEFGHFISCITILLTSVILLFYGYYSLVVMVTIINIIGNVYPVILQRYHRIRIEKLVNHKPL